MPSLSYHSKISFFYLTSAWSWLRLYSALYSLRLRSIESIISFSMARIPSYAMRLLNIKVAQSERRNSADYSSCWLSIFVTLYVLLSRRAHEQLSREVNKIPQQKWGYDVDKYFRPLLYTAGLQTQQRRLVTNAMALAGNAVIWLMAALRTEMAWEAGSPPATEPVKYRYNNEAAYFVKGGWWLAGGMQHLPAWRRGLFRITVPYVRNDRRRQWLRNKQWRMTMLRLLWQKITAATCVIVAAAIPACHYDKALAG
jgi:hypothetical protein